MLIEYLNDNINIKKTVSDDCSFFVLPNTKKKEILENKINIDLDIKSDKSQINIFLFVFSNKKDHSHIRLKCNIMSDNIKCNINSIIFVDDGWICDMKWELFIPKNNKNSNSYLLQENFFLWEWKIRTFPILDINTSNARAEHWSFVHKIDSNKLFYLHSRWINVKLAKRVFIESYINKCLWDKQNKQKNIIIKCLE